MVYYSILLIFYLGMDMEAQPKREATAHSFLGCNLYIFGYRERANSLRQQIDPDENSCCFTCYLPTRLCKGQLQTKDRECFSPELLLAFWVHCPLAIDRIRRRDISDATLEGGWIPETWQPRDFTKEEWRFDTEVIEAAWVFFGFAKRYWQLYGFD